MSVMEPRERVLAALRHRTPARVPCGGAGATREMAAVLQSYARERGVDWNRLAVAADDSCGFGVPYAGSVTPGRDLWGIGRRKQAYGAGEYDEIEHYPLAGCEELRALADFPWPDPQAHDFAGLRGRAEAANPGRRKALIFYGAGNPFEIYCWMTGLEEAMINLLVNPDLVVAALEQITNFFVVRNRLALEACGDLADIVFFADDLGGQTGLLMSRETYRAILQPCHRRLAADVRKLAPQAVTMLHSDGAVFEILPDVMDAGIDVLQAVQTDATGMEPERLKAAYGDRLSFYGAISVQQLLPRADVATVRREVARLMRVFGEGGGYVAGAAHTVQAGTPPENVWAMFETILGPNDFEAALHAAAD